MNDLNMVTLQPRVWLLQSMVKAGRVLLARNGTLTDEEWANIMLSLDQVIAAMPRSSSRRI